MVWDIDARVASYAASALELVLVLLVVRGLVKKPIRTAILLAGISVFANLQLANLQAYRDPVGQHFGGEPATGLPAGKTTQRAVLYSRLSPTGMEFGTVPVPRIREGQVVIQIKAAAVNPVDYKMAGFPFLFVRWLRPIVGIDVSGVVVDSKTPDFKKGDEVFGSADWGSLTEYAAVDAPLLRLKPKSLTHPQAASVVMAFKTSWEALVERAQLKPGHRVLILGGAGGCGSYGIQIAKHIGAWVATTCSERNINFVKKLGADLVVDYGATPNLTAALENVAKFDIVYDTVGDRAAMAVAQQVTGENGYYITIAHPTVPWDGYSDLTVARFTMRFFADNLATAVELADSGKLHTEMQETFKLEQYEEAFNLLRSRRVRGKLVFVP